MVRGSLGVGLRLGLGVGLRLGLGLALVCYFGDEQAQATFVHSGSLRCDAPRRAAPAHVQLCVASLDAPGARCA